MLDLISQNFHPTKTIRYVNCRTLLLQIKLNTFNNQTRSYRENITKNNVNQQGRRKINENLTVQ